MEKASKYEQWQLGALIETTFPSTPVGQSALEYFSSRFQSILPIKLQRNRGFPEEVVIGMAELYDRMIPLVLEARTVLEAEANGLLGPWQEATGTQRMAYQTALTDVVVQSPEMQQLHSVHVGSEEMYEADCHNAVLWLGGWLRAENNPIHETRPPSS